MYSEKTLPKPQKDLPLPEKELEQPHDMLLRKPTLFEKLTFPRWILAFILIILAISMTAYAFTLGSNKQTNTETTPTSTVTPTTEVTPTKTVKETTTSSSTLSPQPSTFPSPTTKVANTQPSITPTPPCASDATKSYYTIQGSYIDGNNTPLVLSGQKVTVTNICTGEVRTSEASPSWSFQNLPKSAYRIAAQEISGYSVHSNNCSGCSFHPNFGGSATSGVDFNLNPQNSYEDVGFQYTQ